MREAHGEQIKAGSIDWCKRITVGICGREDRFRILSRLREGVGQGSVRQTEARVKPNGLGQHLNSRLQVGSLGGGRESFERGVALGGKVARGLVEPFSQGIQWRNDTAGSGSFDANHLPVALCREIGDDGFDLDSAAAIFDGCAQRFACADLIRRRLAVRDPGKYVPRRDKILLQYERYGGFHPAGRGIGN